jgi:hypothetical protein
MKRALVSVAIMVFIVLLVIGYLAAIGMNDRIEARATGNIVEFSNPAIAVQATQLESSFNPFENITVRLEGLFAGKGGLTPKELNLKVEIKGHHRRRLFDATEYFVCSKAEMKEHIRRQLVAITGDQNLKLKNLEVGYLSKN